jgi:dTDP-4-amino-4,6-dideoxygalactose transaminase
MPMFNDIPPTAGFPLRFADLFRLLFVKDGSVLDDDFRKYLGVPYAKICCSGTASLYLIAESIKELTSKRSVVIPAYICPLVPFSLHRAGFKIILCDIMPESLGYDETMLSRICASNDDIAAVVVDHLAGIPVSVDSAERLAKKHRFFIIEDCAQSLGAEYGKKKIGTRGDFAFFSMAAGKGLTMYEGGAIVTRHAKYAELLDRTCERLAKRSALSEIMRTIELFCYTIFYHPRLFWFIFTLPQAFWTWRKDDVKAFREDFSSDFPLHAVSSFRKRAGHMQFSRLEAELNRQRKSMKIYTDGLRTSSNSIIREMPGDRASYPYISFICKNGKERARIFSEFANAGLGVSVIYARALHEYEYLEGIVPEGKFPNAEKLAPRVITFSTSVWMSDDKIRLFCDFLRKTLQGKKI